MPAQTYRELLAEMYQIYGYLADDRYAAEEIQKFWKKTGEALGIHCFKPENEKKQITKLAVYLIGKGFEIKKDESVSDVVIRVIGSIDE